MNYAIIGGTYDESLDAFIPEKEYNSWFFDESICDWSAPVPYPSDGNVYFWDESELNWVDVAVLDYEVE